VAGPVCPDCGLDLAQLAGYVSRHLLRPSREVCASCGALLVMTPGGPARVRLLSTQEAAALALRAPLTWYELATRSADVRRLNGLDPRPAAGGRPLEDA
jgi:hypothetical protein